MDSNYRYVARVNSELEGWDVIDTLEKTNASGDCRDVSDGIWLMTVYDAATLARVLSWLNAEQPVKPKVVVRYGAGEADYSVEPPDSVDVTLVDTDEEEQLFLDHAGVQVYYAVKSMSYSGQKELSSYWVSNFMNTDWDDDEVFDIRDFPAPPQEYLEKYPDDKMPEKTALRWMIDTGQWQ